MLRLVSLALLTAYAVDVIIAAPQVVSTSSPVCKGYMWGVTIELLNNTPMPIYNQYVVTTACAGPAWVQSSTVPTPPSSIAPWGTKYACQVPEMQYYCGETRVVTCCGNNSTATMA